MKGLFMGQFNAVAFFKTSAYPTGMSIALLFLRLVAGIAFILHGWGKIQNPFGWMGAEAAVPGIFQFLAAVAEFGGGIAWVLGLVMPLASFGIAATMVVATGLHLFVLKHPFVSSAGGGSYEPALGYLAVSLLLLASGPGKFSLDAKIFGNK